MPLWRHRFQEDVIYLSEAVLTALRDAHITGLASYSDYDGKPGESIGRFE